MKTEIKTIYRDCNIRSYRYKAYVSKRTGVLLHLTAGCRTWGSFAEAFRHYSDGSPNWRWNKDTMEALRVGYDRWEHARRVAQRMEATELLRKLAVAVTKYRALCHLRRRRKAPKKLATRTR